MGKPKTYRDLAITITLECQGPWSWTCAVTAGDFKSEGLQTYNPHKTPAEALRELATEFEMRAQKQMFYERVAIPDEDSQ